MDSRPISHRADDGFTLVELLIVIVILGILATVTVFAVRGITDQGQDNACAVELRTLDTALESHRAMNGAYGDEAALVASGMLRAESSLYTVTLAGDSYTITPTGGECTQSGSGGSTPPVAMPNTDFSWHGGVTAWRYDHDVNGGSEIVVIGDTTGHADWVAATNATVNAPRRTHFVDITGLDAGSLDQLLLAVNSNGDTELGVYVADDTQPLAGSGATSVVDYLIGSVNRLAAYPNTNFVALSAGGLEPLFAATAP